MLLISGGTVVTEDHVFVGDILVADGKIKEIVPANGPLKTPGAENAQHLDASKKLVFPGGVDSHVHFNYPQGGFQIYSADDFFTGSYSAVCGGTTTFLDFVEAKPDETLENALETRNTDAKINSVCDYSFHMSINKVDQKTLEEIPQIVEKGISSFKIYTAYDGIRLTDEQMLTAFEVLKKCGGLPIVHSENHALIMHEVGKYKKEFENTKKPLHPRFHPKTRPAIGEEEATTRVILLAEFVGVPSGVHIVHVTSERAIPILSQPRSIPVTGEVSCQHLMLTTQVYEDENVEEAAKYVCAPPMREQKDCDAMVKALKNGIVDFVITDHCPFTVAQRMGKRRTPEFRRDYEHNTVIQSPYEEPWFVSGKEKNPIPSFFNMPGGLPSVENRMITAYDHLVIKNKFSLIEFSKVVSTNAAKRFGLYPQKGVIAVGSDADFCLIENVEQTIHAKDLHQNCDYCIFENRKIIGRVSDVILGGEIVVRDNVVQNSLAQRKGNGRLLHTHACVVK